MTEKSPPNKPLNRLRAAAGLIPVIESGLRDKKLNPEKASLMAEFCAWSLEHEGDESDEAKQLAEKIQQGFERIEVLLGVKS